MSKKNRNLIVFGFLAVLVIVALILSGQSGQVLAYPAGGGSAITSMTLGESIQLAFYCGTSYDAVKVCTPGDSVYLSFVRTGCTFTDIGGGKAVGVLQYSTQGTSFKTSFFPAFAGDHQFTFCLISVNTLVSDACEKSPVISVKAPATPAPVPTATPVPVATPSSAAPAVTAAPVQTVVVQNIYICQDGTKVSEPSKCELQLVLQISLVAA